MYPYTPAWALAWNFRRREGEREREREGERETEKERDPWLVHLFNLGRSIYSTNVYQMLFYND